MSQYRYLVTGANGFVGHFLCRRLVEMGLPVRGTFRHVLAASVAGVEQSMVGEIDERTDWMPVLQDIDIVIHLAARVHIMRDDASDPLAKFRQTNTAGTERLARSAAEAGAKRLVYISSVKVNAESTTEGKKVNESDVANPHDPYGISKWEAEQALHRVAGETGLEIVIVRPPLVYGPGVKGNFLQLLRAVAKGIPLPLASVRNFRDLVYVGNLVDAILMCAIHPKAVGQTYMVSDGEHISTPALLRELAEMSGAHARVFPCPTALLRLIGQLSGRAAHIDRLLGSFEIDSTKIRRELDWRPPYTLQQGLQATAQWYRHRHP